MATKFQKLKDTIGVINQRIEILSDAVSFAKIKSRIKRQVRTTSPKTNQIGGYKCRNRKRH